MHGCRVSGERARWGDDVGSVPLDVGNSRAGWYARWVLGPPSVGLAVALLAAPEVGPVQAPVPAPAAAPVPTVEAGPELPNLVADRREGPQVRAPELSFGRPTTLYILGEGRLGTWSLVGSSMGAREGCAGTIAVSCMDLGSAQVGVAWRPFGSLVSLFTAIGASVAPGVKAPPGMLVVGGLQIDLPSLLWWRERRRTGRSGALR